MTAMEADFSGYATKAGLKCTDGRTIMPGAFRHQDQTKVPLVWQHGHTDPENVLGHALLEERDDGVYAYGFFNKSPKANHAHELLEHGDINQMSIWANQLIERMGKVVHGAIREVSLVLAGANPGALIENVTLRHGDGDNEVLDDEAIITTGLELEHAQPDDEIKDETELEDQVIEHAEGDEDETVQDIYETLDEKQKQVVHYMIGVALEAAQDSNLQQDNLGKADDKTTLGDADDKDKEDKDNTMTHTNNVFEKGAKGEKPGSLLDGTSGHVLSHADVEGIVSDAMMKTGSLRDAVKNYALSHGIDDIDTLFPEARALTSVPELDKRRTEWVAGVLNGARKSPFARIKTLSADLTEDEARAKGYIKGELKKEEFFSVLKRVTTPTTIYKKQKLDRDDMIDITDFDVVAFLKGEMRLMTEEEIARAILIGDGRDVASEDKINEQNVRPIAKDHQIYVTTLTVNIDDANSNVSEIIDALILNRRYYKGSGLPTMYTTETVIAQFMLLKDGMDRRLYRSLDELATELRVAAIVPVEVMEEDPSVVAILVNLNDYVIGADKGGAVALFDDFDIDYNQYKYLIETRISGALVKLKSALVVKRTAAGTDTAVVPASPTFNGTQVTIVDTTGVVYRNAETNAVVNAAGSPYAVAEGDVMSVVASPAAGRFFANSADTFWTFRNRAE
jgi:HK97 family phage prohead protease